MKMKMGRMEDSSAASMQLFSRVYWGLLWGASGGDERPEIVSENNYIIAWFSFYVKSQHLSFKIEEYILHTSLHNSLSKPFRECYILYSFCIGDKAAFIPWDLTIKVKFKKRVRILRPPLVEFFDQLPLLQNHWQMDHWCCNNHFNRERRINKSLLMVQCVLSSLDIT